MPITTTPRIAPDHGVSRRGALAALGLGAAGLAIGSAALPASANPGSGFNQPISRAEIMSRAAAWTAGTEQASVAYHMDQFCSKPDGSGAKWRQDCSGFTSMCLKLRHPSQPVGLSTTAFHPSAGLGVLKPIARADMKAGDVFLVTGAERHTTYGHLAVFEKWVDGSKNSAWIYEETDLPYTGYKGPGYTIHHAVNWTAPADGFKTYRYTNIAE